MHDMQAGELGCRIHRRLGSLYTSAYTGKISLFSLFSFAPLRLCVECLRFTTEKAPER